MTPGSRAAQFLRLTSSLTARAAMRFFSIAAIVSVGEESLDCLQKKAELVLGCLRMSQGLYMSQLTGKELNSRRVVSGVGVRQEAVREREPGVERWRWWEPASNASGKKHAQ